MISRLCTKEDETFSQAFFLLCSVVVYSFVYLSRYVHGILIDNYRQICDALSCFVYIFNKFRMQISSIIETTYKHLG